MAGHDIVVIGGSTGAIPALLELVQVLPEDLPASLFVVIHTSRNNPGVLASIIDKRTQLIAATALEHEPIRHGRIYVAPPDRHLLVKPGFVRVVRGPQENGFRPAVDPLFRTAARAYGPRVVGVILSGALDDGAYGLMLVKKHGGVAMVQSPDEAVIPHMPLAAIRGVEVQHILPVAELAQQIVRLAHERLKDEPAMPRNEDVQPDAAELGPDILPLSQALGPPSMFTCPECGGSLWEISEENVVRFRCHVGHGFSVESMIEKQTDGLEAALWTALRALEDQAELCRRMAERAHRGKLTEVAHAHELRESDARRKAAIVRQALMGEDQLYG